MVTSGAFSALRMLYGEAPVHEEPPTVMSFGLPGWPAWSPMQTLETALYCGQAGSVALSGSVRGARRRPR